jgi:hypothetical protein
MNDESRARGSTAAPWLEKRGLALGPLLELAHDVQQQEGCPLTLVGSRVGHIRILSLLGRGGMGELYVQSTPEVDLRGVRTEGDPVEVVWRSVGVNR